MTKVRRVKSVVFPVVMYQSFQSVIKKAECWRIDTFELWCWRRLLRVPWTAKRPNQSILKETSPEYSLEGWCWSWSSNPLATWCEEPIHWKKSWCWQRLKAGGEGNDSGWDGWMDHRLSGHKFEESLGDGEGQGNLECCSPWGCKELDMTEQLNNWVLRSLWGIPDSTTC